MTGSLLTQSLVVILASAGAVAVFARFRLPAALGYLLAGLLIGPHGLGLIEASEEAKFLAELGLIFLMFMVGLEFSLPTLLAARADVLGAGSLQVAMTVLAVAGCAAILGTEWSTGLVLGGAVAMSSTAITLKQLADQGEIGSRHGRLAVAILLFQDLATIPFLVAVGTWSEGHSPSVAVVLQQLAIASIALGLGAFISRPLFRAGLGWVARTKSAELFLITVLLIALGTALTVYVAGLAPPIGAFIAGMVVGESDFRHQIEDDVRPLRDVLVGLFFVTIGMEIDPSVAAAAPGAVLGWVGAFLFGKPALILLTGTILRWPLPVQLRTAVIFAHGGEFGLLLLTMGMTAGIIPEGTGQPALLAMAITMGLAPLLIQFNGWAERLVGPSAPHLAGEFEVAERSARLENHVLICGCGRVGRLVAVVLDAAKVPYLALESDLTRFHRAQQRGHDVAFGDATRTGILEAAGLERARLLILTFDDRRAVDRILHAAHRRNPASPSVVSAADDFDMASLAEAGAAVVFPENLAAGLALADQTLLMCGLTQDEAARIISTVRAETHPELRERVGI